MSTYLDNKDLDLRFNYITGSVGLKTIYKFNIYKDNNSGFMGVGFYFGYYFALNNPPWVYSAGGTRLTTGKKIEIENLVWGISFSWNTNLSKSY